MQWLRFGMDGQECIGILEGDQIRRHAGQMFEPFEPFAPLRDAPSTGVVSIAQVQWLTPCKPSKIIGLWNNFRAAAEKNGWAQPAEPLYFLKSPGSACAHLHPIAVPAHYDGRVVYEGELVVVIGRTAKGVSVQDAPAHIFGYTCGNDLTAIELLHRDTSFGQWTRAKSFDGFAAFGPTINTDFDPSTATVRTVVAGRERQNYALSDMFFSPAELVSRISHDMTLEPGDLIYCGTSLGVLPIKPGSMVDVAIDGIGTLSNRYG